MLAAGEIDFGDHAGADKQGAAIGSLDRGFAGGDARAIMAFVGVFVAGRIERAPDGSGGGAGIGQPGVSGCYPAADGAQIEQALIGGRGGIGAAARQQAFHNGGITLKIARQRPARDQREQNRWKQALTCLMAGSASGIAASLAFAGGRIATDDSSNRRLKFRRRAGMAEELQHRIGSKINGLRRIAGRRQLQPHHCWRCGEQQ